jgi:hypothetical protein
MMGFLFQKVTVLQGKNNLSKILLSGDRTEDIKELFSAIIQFCCCYVNQDFSILKFWAGNATVEGG